MPTRTGLRVDPRRPEPLYEQLFDQIVSRIRSGAMPSGHRLPATRDLAEEVGAHRNTVVRTYEALESAGFVVSKVGRGTFVAPDPPMPAPRAMAEEARLPWSTLVSERAAAEALGRFDRLQANYTAEPPNAVNLARLQPSEDLLPSALFRRCVEHVLRSYGARALGYAPREGLLRLRALIAADLVHQGIPANADDVLVTNGSQQAIDIVVRTLVDPGDVFFVDAATYSGANNLLITAGARLMPVPGDDEGPSIAFLKRHARTKAKGFYVIPNCHNPTGVSLSLARREALVAWSHDAEVPLLEDDYCGDLALGDAPMPPALRALDADVLHVGTFSKKLIPALRLGFLVCPPALRARLVTMKHTLDLCASAFVQHALAEFLERGYMRAHLGKVLPAYRRRRDALERGLASHLPPSIRWRSPEHGLLLWLPLPRELPVERVAMAAQRHGVLVAPSTLFAIDAEVRHGLRLAFCAENESRLQEGARRLGKAVATLAAESRPPSGDRVDVV